MSNNAQQISEENQQDWVREQFQIATKFLASKGLLSESVSDRESRYLAPLLSIWKINLQDTSSVWVITGDLPSDYSPLSVANDARDAVRHFSLKWHMQADKLLSSPQNEQVEFAHLLIEKAERLYELFNINEFWQ